MQVTKFNKALQETAFGTSSPRLIDGIMLTKFDTIDDKVGAAVSIYVSSYYYICALILLCMCPHTTTYVSSYYYICVLILLLCPHTTICVLILLCVLMLQVGAAVSMVYVTGQPVVLVGVGQTYTDLKKLNAHNIVKLLLR